MRARAVGTTPTLLIVAGLVGFPLYGLIYAAAVSPDSRLDLATLLDVLRDPLVHQALRNTLVISFSASLLALLAGIALAWIVARTDAPLRGLFRLAVIIPLATTPFVGAFAWSILASPRSGLLNSWALHLTGAAPFDIYSLGGIIWVVALYMTPYVYFFVSTAFAALDAALLEASFVTGASPLRSELAVTIPLVIPQILSSYLLVCVLSMEEFGAPAVLGLPARQYVMSTALYARFQTFPPDYGVVVAMAGILVAITAIGTYLQQLALRRSWRFTVISGKARPLAPWRLGAWRHAASLPLIAYLLFAVLMPMGILLGVATADVWRGHIDPAHFTLRNFVTLARDDISRAAMENAVMFGLAAALLTVLLGLAAAAAGRGRGALGTLIEQLSMLPLGIPGIVIATGLIFGFLNSPIALYGTVFGLIAAYIIRYLPYAVRGAAANLHQLNPELVEMAHIAGVGPLRAFATIVLPLLRAGLLGTGAIVFASILRELAASVMLVAPDTQVIATLLFGYWHDALFERAAALAVLSVVIAVAIVGLATRLTGTDVFGRRDAV